MQDSTFADIYLSEFSSFIFKVPVEKVVIDEEELHGTEINGFLNLLDNLSRTIFIDSECWNLKVVVDVETHQKYYHKEEARRFTSL